MSDAAITIRIIQADSEARAAAEIMAGTDPWITLGRSAEQTYKNVSNPLNESYVALAAPARVVGIIVVSLPIPLVKGYIAALAVHQDYRNRGVGAQLLAHAEKRIFQISPNVFLTVSSFNSGAQRFYYRHGYQLVGELKDYLIAGESELLLRKRVGPWSGFSATS